MWVTAGQAADLRDDPRVESLTVEFDGRYNEPIDPDNDVPDPDQPHLHWQRHHDVDAAFAELKRELPKPARVLELRFLQGKGWREVAKEMGLSIRQCQNLLRRAIKFLKERFPELGEY